MKTKRSPVSMMELIFDTLYLGITTILGLILILMDGSFLQKCWGAMALILVFGDSFHLIPRMASAYIGEKKRFIKALGIGKLITSITMTLFYLILWHIGINAANISLPYLTAFVWFLAIIRIVLCLLPQNKWIIEPSDYRFGIYRNIPFLIQGLTVAWLFAVYPTNLPLMWLAILLSFGFYIPVVLFADKQPKFGMFMLPKTCVYVWIVTMGFSLMQL